MNTPHSVSNKPGAKQKIIAVCFAVLVLTTAFVGAIFPTVESGRSAAVAPDNNIHGPWANGPSNDPNFFPIGVWLQSPANIREFQKIGVNLFIGFFGDLDQGSLSQFAAARMPLIPTQNSIGLVSAQNHWIQGWDQMDEPDNAQPNGSGGYGPCIAPGRLIATYNSIKANDASRPVFLNFGRGVADINYIGWGSFCHGDTSYYQQAMQAGDVISFDIYPVSEYSGQLELVPKGGIT